MYRFLCFLLVVIFPYAYGDEKIVLKNDSNCDLKLIYSDLSPVMKKHSASSLIKRHSSGYISVNIDDAKDKEDLFVDDYIAHCGVADIDVYIIGFGYDFGWDASIETNRFLKISNANIHNENGDVIKTQYSKYNSVIIEGK